MADKPHFVFRDGMTADRDYVPWIADIKSRYRNSQIKATIRVNSALMEFYWSVGRDLAALKAEDRWGSGIVKQLVPSQPSFSRLGIVLTLSDSPSALGLSNTFALDMRNAFPEAKGFSDTNVKCMKRWYMFYYEQVIKRHQTGDQINVTERSRQLADQIEVTEKSHQVGGPLEMPDFHIDALAHPLKPLFLCGFFNPSLCPLLFLGLLTTKSMLNYE